MYLDTQAERVYVSLHVSDTEAAAEAAAGTYFIPLFAFACTLLQGISSTYTHVEYVRRTIILLGSKYVLFSLFMSSGEGETAVSHILNCRQPLPLPRFQLH